MSTASGRRRSSQKPTPAAPAGRLLNYEEAGQRLGLSARFARRLVEERRITFVRVNKRRIRIPESAIEEWIAKHTVEPLD